MEYFPWRTHKGEMQEIQEKMLQALLERPDHLIFFCRELKEELISREELQLPSTAADA